MTALRARPDNRSVAEIRERAFPRSGVSYWLSRALAVASAATAAGTFFVPGVLTGPAAMNGLAAVGCVPRAIFFRNVADDA
jgi:hypothetical protein